MVRRTVKVSRSWEQAHMWACFKNVDDELALTHPTVNRGCLTQNVTHSNKNASSVARGGGRRTNAIRVWRTFHGAVVFANGRIQLYTDEHT